MNDLFKEPVTISLATDLGVRNIANVRDALHVLTHYWPAPGTPDHFNAHRVCLAALGGVVPAAIARDAFVNAARKARVLTTDEQGSQAYS